MRSHILAIAVTLTAGAAAAQQADDSQAWFESPSRLTQQTGEGIYNAVCVACHMPGGEGAIGAGEYPALAGNEAIAFPDYPIYITVHGQAAMPPLGSILDDAQVAAVVNYIRTSFGNEFTEDPATPEMVAEIR